MNNKKNIKIICIVPDKVVLEEISPILNFLKFDICIADVNNIILHNEVPFTISNYQSCIVKPIKNRKLNIFFSVLITAFQKLGLPFEFLVNLKLKERLKYYAEDYFVTFHSNQKDSQYVVLVNANNDPLVNSILSRYKSNNYSNVKIIAIAHARAVLTNTLHNKNLYFLPKGIDYFSKSGIRFVDKIQIDSPIVFNRYKLLNSDLIKNAKILESLRYTKEWNSFSLNCVKMYKSRRSTVDSKRNVLYLHSNFDTNIFEYEVRRSIIVISKFCDFLIGFRPHIRMGTLHNDKEMKYLFQDVKPIEIFSENFWEALNWSDVVIFYGSSSCVDALIAGKTVIFLLYATSNTIDTSLFEYMHVCHSPDEFINTVYLLSINSLPPKKQYLVPDLNFLIDQWNNFIIE
jgi:hypothetical protein